MSGWWKAVCLIGGFVFAGGAVVVALVGSRLAWMFGAWAAALVGFTFLACAVALFRVGAGLLRKYGQVP